MSQELLNELKSLNNKIDVLVRLKIYDKIRNRSQREQIGTLSNLKFKNVEIAEILGVTPNNVNVTLNQIRKSKKNENK